MYDNELDEVRILAEKLGYRLVPIRKYERFLPCKCGCNRRAHWSCGWAKGNGYILLKCSRCGFSVKGDTEAEAKRNWNEAIKGER